MTDAEHELLLHITAQNKRLEDALMSGLISVEAFKFLWPPSPVAERSPLDQVRAMVPKVSELAALLRARIRA